MLGCIQPMSSPMMKRMLGFCGCCAAAGRHAARPTAMHASGASHSFRMAIMVETSLLGLAQTRLAKPEAAPHRAGPHRATSFIHIFVSSAGTTERAASALFRRRRSRPLRLKAGRNHAGLVDLGTWDRVFFVRILQVRLADTLP